MIHCSFQQVLQVIGLIPSYNYANLPTRDTRDTTMLSYAVVYASFRPQTKQPTQHQELFHFCIKYKLFHRKKNATQMSQNDHDES